MNAAPQPGSVIQLRSTTWKVLGTSGLKRGFREVQCRSLSGLVRETLDAIEENPTAEAFERMMNAHLTRLHKKVINNPITKKIVMAKRVALDQIKKRMAFPASIERPPRMRSGTASGLRGLRMEAGSRATAKTPQTAPWWCTASAAAQGGVCRGEFTYKDDTPPKASA